MPSRSTRITRRKDYGDFQTPSALVVEILETLEAFPPQAERILEPTCGVGRFLAEILDRPVPPREFRGLEIQAEHADLARLIVDPSGQTRIAIETVNLFEVDLRTDLHWVGEGPLLVIGNLPWVTTSALGASGGVNGPPRTNHKRRRGIDALTGESNFDISEAIWFKLIRELAPERPTIALLCKTAVARSVLNAIHSENLPITRATIWRIDAQRWFRASVDACLLRVEVGPGPLAVAAEVFDQLSATEPETTLGVESGRLIADLPAYRRFSFADGVCPLQWRQGVKHDATAIMELVRSEDSTLRNKLGEAVDVEPNHVYPLFKGTDLAVSTTRSARSVILTQTRLADDTRELAQSAPKLWSYLTDHARSFDRRKSSIYRGRPPFAMFGIGAYSFAPYKVAISGLHKSPVFRVVGPVEGQPTMLDDTCYFLPCRTLEQAQLLVRILNGSSAIGLLGSLMFRDAKRPVTKALLQRLDLRVLLNVEGLGGLWQEEWAEEWGSRTQKSSTR